MHVDSILCSLRLTDRSERLKYGRKLLNDGGPESLPYNGVKYMDGRCESCIGFC